MREWLARIVDWFRRDRLDAELREELEFHRAQLERDTHAGDDAVEARWAARRRFGNVTRVREESRDRWSVPWLDHLQQDIRYAMRGLRRSPGFTLGAIVTLGLGIGANAAMFGVIDRLMLRPHAYLRDAGRVHRVYLQYKEQDRQITRESIEYTRYLDLRRWTTSFSATAAYAHGAQAIGTGEAARERPIAAVSASFFGFFDARPALGRFFLAAEDTTPVGASVAVLDYGFWKSDFGGRNVLGEPIQVGNITATIVGVAPRGFTGVAEDEAPAVYVPITAYAGNLPGEDGKSYFIHYYWGWMNMMVRRKADVSVAAANADLTNAYARSWNAERGENRSLEAVSEARPRAVASSLRSAAGPDPGLEARTLVWVSGVAVVVLLIACANVANLFLARALRRRRELALRVALGVSRRRLVAQSFTETIVLSLFGFAAGLAVAQWGGAVLRRLFIGETGPTDVVTDGRTLVVALLAALGAALLTGLAPVFFGVRADVASALKSGPREGSYQRSRARGALLVAQGALSMVLLVGAGLFVRSLEHVREKRMGFDADRLLIVRRNLRGADMSDSAQARLGRQLLATAQNIPGVESAAWISSVPFWTTSAVGVFVPGVPSTRGLGLMTYQQGSTDYFRTMGTRILRGRGFTNDDRATSPRVAVVSESMARVLWPDANPIGQCMRVGADTMPCTTVVGVAEDVAHVSLAEDAPNRYYVPIEQFRPAAGYAVMLRMRGDPSASAERVRAALQSVMPGQTYVTVRPLSAVVNGERRSWRVGATMFVAFGVLALVVAAVGLYGVVAYNVAQRMQELGVRVALGAQTRDVVRLVVGQGVRFAVAGVTLGTVLALLAARWVQPLLFAQSATDVRVFGTVGGVLVLVAIVASGLPARRATRVDPNTVLRAD
ncbi:MAG TPA: ADOP family duplicated permease [Gemmatimonadaceae bacterium]|nr:ADOP family duplicated permease [Gemmatimonadaceae bacterium]